MINQFLLSLLLIQATLVAGKGKEVPQDEFDFSKGKKWLTLNGGEPIIVANGGYSGVGPESSPLAYILAQQTSLPNTVLLCNIQYSKDRQPYCLSRLNLENSTTIATTLQGAKRNTYQVNGQDITGIFGVDYDISALNPGVDVVQSNYARPPVFDGQSSFWSPTNIVGMPSAPNLWLNVEYPSFYEARNVSIPSILRDSMAEFVPAYLSSPEVAFLKEMAAQVDKATTKVFLKVTDLNDTEPTTKKPYAALLTDLKAIKTYASGVILPKDSIWPVDAERYLLPATSYVSDLHKAGLEVFASGFANDNYLSYNYSYDPTKEYLQFIDNSQFSVDGVLTDFPSTASEAIACLLPNPNASRVATDVLIISHDGASGDYPGCSDLAYQKAIDDGADIIDCTVQMSKDGVAFCSPAADLTAATTAANSFLDRASKIPEIQERNGIFSFDLTWAEIQTLKPQLTSYFNAPLIRNPAYKNAGKIVTLAQFLDLAKTKAVPGVLINIENAAYIASKKGLDLVGAAATALRNASFDKQPTKKVMIQSEDGSVLSKFQNVKSYEKVLAIREDASSATKETAQQVKKYADAVTVSRNSIVTNYPAPIYLSKSFSKLVEVMHAENISVYVGILRNEFQNFLFDYVADPYIELATLLAGGVNGVITDFPATATASQKSPCSYENNNAPLRLTGINVGDMFKMTRVDPPPEVVPPPVPLIKTSNIVANLIRSSNIVANGTTN